VHFLAELPLDPQVRIGGDSGSPIALRKGEGEPFLELARNAAARVAEVSAQEGPKIEVSD
jgi:ATP-binding protein involved in chromosome partitioning